MPAIQSHPFNTAETLNNDSGGRLQNLPKEICCIPKVQLLWKRTCLPNTPFRSSLKSSLVSLALHAMMPSCGLEKVEVTPILQITQALHVCLLDSAFLEAAYERSSKLVLMNE